MRLRLIVERNDLPPTNLIWYIDAGSSPSIYQLLEKVNDVVPLESDDWGLEDYAVELKGSNGANFEGLHFQEVTKVFKEEDEVIIRPLLSKDMKVRRISGRHQISTDGKRLYDGVAFGRPLLRIPYGRPGIMIPPRKKARLMISEAEDDDDDEEFTPVQAIKDQEEESENKERQLIIHADFDDDDAAAEKFSSDEDEDIEDKAEESGSSSSGSDEEMADNESMADELNDLLADAETEIKRPEPGAVDRKAEHSDSTSGSDSEECAVEIDSDEEALGDVLDEHERELIRKLKSAFPDSAMGVCKHVVQGANGDMEIAWVALKTAFTPALPQSAFAKTPQEQVDAPTPKKSKKASAQLNVSSPASLPRSRKRSASIMEDSDEPAIGNPHEFSRFDQQGLPPGSIQSGKALSFMADVAKGSRSGSRKSNAAQSSKINFTDEAFLHGLTSTPFIDMSNPKDDSSSSEDSSDESSSDGDSFKAVGQSDGATTSSESGDSIDEPSSDGGSFKAEVESDDATTSSNSDSSDDSDTSADSDSAQKPVSINPTNISFGQDEERSDSAQDSGTSSSDSDSDSSDDAPEEVSSKSAPEGKRATVPPSKGKVATQKRNRRRQKTNVYHRYRKTGVIPAGTTYAEFQKMHGNNISSLADAYETKKGAVQNEDFESQRQELLQAIAFGGVDIEGPPGKSTKVITEESPAQSSQEASEALSLPIAPEAQPSPPTLQKPTVQRSVAEKRPSTAPDSSADAPASVKAGPASTGSFLANQRRNTVNVSAMQRLLFGNLGKRAPKTKKDEDKLREEFAKDIKPVKVVKATEAPISSEAEKENLDSWRDTINYRAVECSGENVELSEPPFPFVQRWDPKQQTSRSGDKRRNGHQRNDSQYYEDTPAGNPKRRKSKHQYEPADASNELSSQEKAINVSIQMRDAENEIGRQLRNDNQAITNDSQEPDDLAPLPEDLASLPNLREGEAKPGMVIAFKQLEMFGWAPRESGFKTAIIIGIEGEGELDMTLAKRDRVLSSKTFDESGNRIYGKFEMPDDDEGDEGREGGLCLPFYELREPKIVVDAPTVDELEALMDETVQPKKGQSTDESVIVSHEVRSHDEAPETQFTHVTETVMDSDAPEPTFLDESQLDVKQDAQVQEVIESMSQEPPFLSEPQTGSVEDAQVEKVERALLQEGAFLGEAQIGVTEDAHGGEAVKSVLQEQGSLVKPQPQVVETQVPDVEEPLSHKTTHRDEFLAALTADASLTEIVKTTAHEPDSPENPHGEIESPIQQESVHLNGRQLEFTSLPQSPKIAESVSQGSAPVPKPKKGDRISLPAIGVLGPILWDFAPLEPETERVANSQSKEVLETNVKEPAFVQAGPAAIEETAPKSGLHKEVSESNTEEAAFFRLETTPIEETSTSVDFPGEDPGSNLEEAAAVRAKTTTIQEVSMTTGQAKEIIGAIIQESNESLAEPQPEDALESELVDAQFPRPTDSLPHAQVELNILEPDITDKPSTEIWEQTETEATESHSLARPEPTNEDQLVDASNETDNESALLAADAIPPHPATPVKATNAALEDILEEDRADISLFLKEAGLRTSLPSELLKDIRPEGMVTPDAAVFEKLRQDMSELEQGMSYSPNYADLGSSEFCSSPSRQQEEPLQFSVPDQRKTSTSPEPSQRRPSRSPAASIRETSRSSQLTQQADFQSPNPDQSSWQTVHDNDDKAWEDEEEEFQGLSDTEIAEVGLGGVDAELPKLFAEVRETTPRQVSEAGKRNDLPLSPVKALHPFAKEPAQGRQKTPVLTSIEKSLPASPVVAQVVAVVEPPKLTEMPYSPLKASTPKSKSLAKLAKTPKHAKTVESKSLSKASSPAMSVKSKTPTRPAVKPKSRKIPRAAPISNAEELWDSWKLKPKRQESSVGNSKPDFNAMDLEVFGEKEANSVEYPKLSPDSSFTSQVTDHGRQPDFDDGEMTNSETSIVAGISGHGEDAAVREELKLPPFPRNKVSSNKRLPKKEPESRKIGNGPFSTSDGSDIDFPHPSQILSQPLPDREKVLPPKRLKPPAGRKMVQAPSLDDSSDGLTRPRASQQQKNRPVSRRSQGKKPPNRPSTPRGSQSQFQSQSQRDSQQPSSRVPGNAPKAFLFMDLTLSSDVEQDVATIPRAPEKDRPNNVTHKKRERKYDHGNTDDEEYDGGHIKTEMAKETRRHPSAGLRDSSQASNKSRRKTSAR